MAAAVGARYRARALIVGLRASFGRIFEATSARAHFFVLVNRHVDRRCAAEIDKICVLLQARQQTLLLIVVLISAVAAAAAVRLLSRRAARF